MTHGSVYVALDDLLAVVWHSVSNTVQCESLYESVFSRVAWHSQSVA